jgi:hypothetical protein
MTRQQYLISRNHNPLDVVYDYYLNHEKRKHNPIPPQELYMLLQTKGWNLNQIVSNVLQEYDVKFEVISLLDKNGNLIKQL